MKKSLLALAAIGAFASTAQAQSSVTVYGILDLGYVGSSYSGTSATANASSTGAGSTTAVGGAGLKQTTSGFGQSAESTSRLGFRGSEDLGGGLSAVFTAETALNPDGSASAFAFNRQTFVGLKKNDIGQGTIGTQYTPIYDVMTSTDAAGLNNLVGNAVYGTSLQSSTGTYNTGLAPYTSASASAVSINATSGAYVTRASNAFKFQSVRFSGFQGQLFVGQSNMNNQQNAAAFSTATNAGGPANNSIFGANVDYVWNKLNVVAAYQTFRAYSVMNPTATAQTLANGTAGSYGQNMSDSQTYAAATYDFGILKGYAQYITRKAFSTLNDNTQTQRSAYQLGARSWITPTVSVFATYGLGKSSYLQAGTAYANFRTTQLGADYYLSKRTNLYALYGSTNQSSPGNAALGIAGVSAMNYAVGMRHTF